MLYSANISKDVYMYLCRTILPVSYNPNSQVIILKIFTSIVLSIVGGGVRHHPISHSDEKRLEKYKVKKPSVSLD